MKVSNNTGNTAKNVLIKGNIPDHTEFTEKSIYNKDWSYNANDNALYYNISELEAGETIVLSYAVKIKKYSQDVKEALIDNTVVAITQDGEQYESNILTSKVRMIRWGIEQTSEHEEILKDGDKVKYLFHIKNEGLDTRAVNILDQIPGEIQVESAKIFINTELEQDKDIFTDNEVKFTQVLEPGQELVLEIEGTVFPLDDKEKVQITNVGKILIEDGEYHESNIIINTIINEDWEEPEEPEEPETFSVSGLAWVDENNNGIREEDEELLKDVKVLLYGEDYIETDENGALESTYTTINGTYKFNYLKPGKYTVVFVYDNTKYKATKYQVTKSTEENNSDVIEKEIEVKNEDENEKIIAGVTNTIEIVDKDIKNIDIGLSKKQDFDLKLDKYVSKVVLNTSKGSTTYEFPDGTNFTKVEIGANRISGTIVLVEYDIAITNEGDINGYVSDIVDYIPNELNFSSDMNQNWYMSTDKNLHYIQLETPVIKPGETKHYKLVLTKTLSNSSLGTIENIAEIGEATNLEGIEEKDSTPKNKKVGEDDMSTASLIISVATGSPTLYIGIVILSLALIGTAIYIINKKVIIEEGGNI